MSYIPIKLRRRIPRIISRSPLLRSIDSLQYSEEMDVAIRLEKLEAVFPKTHLEGEKISYEQTFVLAMSARVGSTALLEWLKLSGLSKFKIREIFNNRGMMANFAKEWKATTLCEYLNNYSELCGDARLPFKTNWWDMAPILQMIDGDIETWFPNARWVYLERRDIVAQAYSLWKISKHPRAHVRKDETYSSPITGTIPLDGIRERIRLIELENDQWKKFFDERKIAPHCIYYEDFLNSPDDVIRSTYHAFTGLPLDTDAECPIKRSSDDRDIANVEALKKQLFA